MRGFVVPNEKNADYWAFARFLLNEKTFLEWLLLGPDRNVQLHLLVPTQWGFLLNGARRERIATVINHNADKLDVLRKQQEHLSVCAKCSAQLEDHPSKPYQLVLRVASGQSISPADVWNYDFFFSFFCYNCQTVKTCALMLSSDTIYAALAKCIFQYGFCEAFAPNVRELSLLDAYLERFILLNHFEETILETTMFISQYCYHCGKQKKKLRTCSVCGIIRFCKRGDCYKKSSKDNYHQNHLCLALRERSLFHVDEALFVSRDGKILEANLYQKIT
jgi:hypothetical protein